MSSFNSIVGSCYNIFNQTITVPYIYYGLDGVVYLSNKSKCHENSLKEISIKICVLYKNPFVIGLRMHQ